MLQYETPASIQLFVHQKLENINERGKLNGEWCRENNFIISNTWFQNFNTGERTLISGGDRVRSQIDYFNIRNRLRNAVEFSKFIPGANYNSVAVVTPPVKVQLKKQKKTSTTRTPKHHIEYLTIGDDIVTSTIISL